MNDTELKERYAQEPWGKLLIEMGMEPYDTESSARRVAEYAAERLATSTKLINRLEAFFEGLDRPHADTPPRPPICNNLATAAPFCSASKTNMPAYEHTIMQIFAKHSASEKSYLELLTRLGASEKGEKPYLIHLGGSRRKEWHRAKAENEKEVGYVKERAAKLRAQAAKWDKVAELLDEAHYESDGYCPCCPIGSPCLSRMALSLTDFPDRDNVIAVARGDARFNEVNYEVLAQAFDRMQAAEIHENTTATD